MAQEIAISVGMTIDSDLCILNDYDAEGRMGVHQLTLRRYDVTPDPSR